MRTLSNNRQGKIGMGWRPWVKKQPVRQPHLASGRAGYVFRRSRTLTGSTSPRITTGAAGRGQLKTERLKLHELKTQRLHLLRALIIVSGIALCLTFLLLNVITLPQIQYGQKGRHSPNTTVYQKSINSYLNDRPLERFGFALSGSDLASYLLSAHTELRAVTVERAWYGGNVRFTLLFRQPLLAWKTGADQFYVDSQGIAFRYNHFAEPSVLVTDQSGIAPTSGGAIASTRFIAFLGQMVGAINNYSKGRVEAVIIPASTREIDLKLQGRGYIIKTHSDRDPLEQAQDINNALGYFDQKGIQPQYVDVRVAHKAFYK